MLKILLGMYLIFFPLISHAQSQPRFYFGFNAEFSDMPTNKSININKNIGIRVEGLYKKFRKTDPYNIIIPADFIKNAKYKIFPRLTEKLWAFNNSKLIGITQANQYLIKWGEMDDSKNLVFSVKNSRLYQYPTIFVSVPPDTKKEDLPTESQNGELSTIEGKNILKMMDDASQDYSAISNERRLIKGIDDDYYAHINPTFTVVHTSTPSVTETPTVTETSTNTPTPTFKEKTDTLLKGIFQFVKNVPVSTPSPRVTPTPSVTPTATPVLFTPTPTATIEPFSWIRNGVVAETINFKKEKVVILTAKAVFKYHRRGVSHEESAPRVKNLGVNFHGRLDQAA